MPELRESAPIATPIRYATSIQWTRSHQGTVSSAKKPDVAVVCPPPFCHERDDAWSPEEFFVSAVEMCLMMTFIMFAERAEIGFLSYESRAEGFVEFVEKKAQFTRIDLYPVIHVADERLQKKAGLMLKAAARNCLITASIKTDVEVHPEILIRPEVAD